MLANAEDEQEGGEIAIDDEVEEETEPIRGAQDPGQPTARQVEDHRRSHLPYRLWCKWCVMGRGRGRPHRRTSGSDIAVIGLDYFFITREGVKKREELDFNADEQGQKEAEEARA